MSTTFYSQKPKDSDLKKYISHYYFHESKDIESHINFSFYPHFKNALTIYKDSKVELVAPNHSRVTPLENDYVIAYSQIFKRFAKAEIHGPFRKIGIVFEPLGLNHFVSAPLSELTSMGLNLNFNYFNTSLLPILNKLFDINEIEDRVTLLDIYFKSQFKGLSEKRISASIDLMFNKSDKYSVQEIADSLGVNRKTLLRLFRKHLNCSVQDYNSLIQFRKAIETYQKSSKKPLLTELSCDFNFYDQSDFINHFRKVTNFNPKKFFDKLIEFGDHEIFWSPD